MRTAGLEIITGKVVDVQLTERTLIEEPSVIRPRGARAPRAAPKHTGVITGRLRLFLDGPGLNDPHYDFEQCELPVHRDQIVAIASYRRRKKAPAERVLLRNLSSEKECVFEAGLAAMTPPPWFGPRWKAFGLSLIMFGAGYVLSRFVISPDHSPTWWVGWPFLFAILAYPVFWGLMILSARIGRGARRKAALIYVRREMAARASRDETAAPAVPGPPATAPAPQQSPPVAAAPPEAPAPQPEQAPPVAAALPEAPAQQPPPSA